MSGAFQYPEKPLVRKHGPKGYADHESYRPWLRDEFAFRCVYCLSREQWGRLRAAFEVDHFLPVSVNPAARLDYGNLVYACAACNNSKGMQALPDPCRVLIDADVRVLEDGTIQTKNPEALRLVEKLGLDDPECTEFRMLWIGITELARTRHPELHRKLMGFPQDLPSLHRLKPPQGNARPEGLAASFSAQRQKGTLPAVY
jgi:HNH endonuclease